MASEERKAADAKIEAENLFKTLGAGEQQAETDAFQCGRCKQVRPSSVTRKEGAKLFPSASAVIASNKRGALMNR